MWSRSFSWLFCSKRLVRNIGSKEPTAWELEPNAAIWECHNLSDSEINRVTQIFVLSLRGPHWAFTRNSSPPPASSSEEVLPWQMWGTDVERKSYSGTMTRSVSWALPWHDWASVPDGNGGKQLMLPAPASPSVWGGLTHRDFLFSCQILSVQSAGGEEGTTTEMQIDCLLFRDN